MMPGGVLLITLRVDIADTLLRYAAHFTDSGRAT
ncbi:MAG: hypothetical protein ACI8Y4_000587 [Candidatus Poriferisodalaceae bacterium]|jgi:hypothetical protein